MEKLLLLAKYRQRRSFNLYNSTGLVQIVNRIQILAINWHRSPIHSWNPTGVLLPLRWSLLLVKYRQVNYANLRQSTDLVLDINRIQILAISWHRNLIDNWCSTVLLLVQYWLPLLAKYRQRGYPHLRHIFQFFYKRTIFFNTDYEISIKFFWFNLYKFTFK